MPPSNADQNAWVERVLGIRVAAPTAASETASETAGHPARLQALGNQLKSLREGPVQPPQAVLEAFRQAVAAVKTGAPEAAALLAALETGIAALHTPTIDLPGLAKRWLGAWQQAGQALQDIAAGILSLDEVVADPRFPHVRDALDGLPALLPADTVTPLFGTAAQPALAALGAYRRALAAVPEIPRLEALAAKYATAAPVCAPLDAEAAAIEQALAKAA